MANQFRNINYGRLLFESMRYYFAVNASGNLTELYKYLAAIVQPMQGPFDAYVVFRIMEALIASCKWQIGQLTNVLNFLFDNVLNRIFITQAVSFVIADPIFNYAPVNFDSDFNTAPEEQERVFSDSAAQSLVTIHAPLSVSLPALTAVIEQIRLRGIPYQIVQS